MKRYSRWILAIIICIAVGIAGHYMYSLRFNEYVFTGNTSKYTDEELKKLIFATELEQNPIYYMFFAEKDREIPFIAKYDVDITWPDKVKVSVYGKNVIGYVYYKDFYFYFDKDGIVAECSSSDKIEGAILVEGLEFGQMVLYEKLPTDNEETFTLILSLTKMLKKSEINVDKLEFDKELNIMLHIGNVEVMLGKDEYLDEKITKVKDLLPTVSGYAGTLYMADYKEGTDNFWFRKK